MNSTPHIDRVSREALATAYLEVLGNYIDLRQYLRLTTKNCSADEAINRLSTTPFWVDGNGDGGIEPTREQRRVLLRAVLFLHSDLPYEYGDSPVLDCSGCLLALVTCGLYLPVHSWLYRDEIRKENAKWNAGDSSVWPFYRKADYDVEYAKSCPLMWSKAV